MPLKYYYCTCLFHLLWQLIPDNICSLCELFIPRFPFNLLPSFRFLVSYLIYAFHNFAFLFYVVSRPPLLQGKETKPIQTQLDFVLGPQTNIVEFVLDDSFWLNLVITKYSVLSPPTPQSQCWYLIPCSNPEQLKLSISLLSNSTCNYTSTPISFLAAFHIHF